ncbi:MAG TPA: HNH endonuclease [Trueperaceae bacterium]|nr:HNH endonuclease [Trueperaceae bacterium]
MAVSKRTRFEVLRRDNHTCRYCRSTENPLTVDHVTPIALGGSDAPDNLVTACRDCNAGKSSTSPDATLVADVAEDAVRWANAMKRATAIRGRKRAAGTRYVNAVDATWENWTHNGGESIPRPGDWEPSTRKFYELGLPLAEMQDAVQIAMGRKDVAAQYTWRYACGIAWNMLSEIQQAAGDIVRAGAADGT